MERAGTGASAGGSVDVSVLDGVTGATGTLVLNHDGSTLNATGDLQGDAKVAANIYQLVLDCTGILTASSSQAPFKKLTVSYSQHAYVICVHNNHIYAVKRTL